MMTDSATSRDYHEVMTFPKINSDLFVMAYATYVAALADASLQDNQQDAPLFVFAKDFGVDGGRLGLSGFDQYFWNSNLDSIWDQPQF